MLSNLNQGTLGARGGRTINCSPSGPHQIARDEVIFEIVGRFPDDRSVLRLPRRLPTS